MEQMTWRLSKVEGVRWKSRTGYAASARQEIHVVLECQAYEHLRQAKLQAERMLKEHLGKRGDQRQEMKRCKILGKCVAKMLEEREKREQRMEIRTHEMID